MKPCKLWMGRLSYNGYGVDAQSRRVHRVAYCEHHGIPLQSIDGLLVRHSCDVRNCYEPEHLSLGSAQDNHDDMVARGRDKPPPVLAGLDSPHALFTAEQVRAIRSTYKPRDKEFGASAMARQLGVNKSTIFDILTGKTYGDVL